MGRHISFYECIMLRKLRLQTIEFPVWYINPPSGFDEFYLPPQLILFDDCLFHGPVKQAVHGVLQLESVPTR